MKELSIEEKAKRYDELKVTAQELEHDGCFDKITLFDLFPELKDSDDEKIRKAIYNCVNWFGFDSCYFKDVTQEECLAWLERQGEQNLANSEKTCKDEQKPNNTVRWTPQEEHYIRQLESIVKEEWRKAENIPSYVRVREMTELMFFLKHLTPTIISTEVKEAMYDKPWSEEDESLCKEIQGMLGVCRIKEHLSSNLYENMCNWLKSFKNRVQPKQEWSEEDEKGLGDALWAIQQAASIAKDENDMGNLWYAENWLKSLRPQSTWKPSDEQMATFWDAICTLSHDGYKWVNDMKSLFQDLKKLKG